MQFADDQAASRLILSDGRVLTKCDQCQQMYAERNPPGDPPCEKCRVEFREENRDAINIFYVVRNQLIMGFSGPVEINHQAIHEAMRLYKIRNRRECFEKVLTLSRWWIGEMREKD